MKTLTDIYKKYASQWGRNGSSVEGKVGTSDLIRRIDMPQSYFEDMFKDISTLCLKSCQVTKQEMLNRISKIPKIEMNLSDIKEALYPKEELPDEEMTLGSMDRF